MCGDTAANDAAPSMRTSSVVVWTVLLALAVSRLADHCAAQPGNEVGRGLRARTLLDEESEDLLADSEILEDYDDVEEEDGKPKETIAQVGEQAEGGGLRSVAPRFSCSMRVPPHSLR